MHRPPAFASTLRAHTRTDTVASRATERFQRPSIGRSDAFSRCGFLSRVKYRAPKARSLPLEREPSSRYHDEDAFHGARRPVNTPVPAIVRSRRRVNEPFRVSVPKTTINSCATIRERSQVQDKSVRESQSTLCELKKKFNSQSVLSTMLPSSCCAVRRKKGRLAASTATTSRRPKTYFSEQTQALS